MNISPRASRTLAVVVSIALVASGCAPASGRIAATPGSPRDTAILAEYVQQLPPGRGVRVERRTGGTIRGILMKATSDTLVVQRHTRIPEPPIELRLTDVLRVTPDTRNGRSLAKAIGVGAAAGAAAALGVFLVVLAAIGD